MLPEYDFSKAVRGKHYKPLHEGYSVHIHKADGTTIVEHYKLEDGAVAVGASSGRDSRPEDAPTTSENSSCR